MRFSPVIVFGLTGLPNLAGVSCYGRDYKLLVQNAIAVSGIAGVVFWLALSLHCRISGNFRQAGCYF